MINRDWRFSRRYPNVERIHLLEGSVYIYQKGIEERSMYVDSVLAARNQHVRFVEVAFADESNDVAKNVASGKVFNLRSMGAIDELIDVERCKNLYLDASGLNVRILAPLLRRGLELAHEKGMHVFVIYAEPITYKIQRFSEAGEYYDLSERIREIAPIPGFGRICQSAKEVIIIPFLGFEGGRFAHVLANLQEDEKEVYPIIGVSGYRPEYPFVSYYGNRRTLREGKSWANVVYAMAGSIVDGFDELVRLRQRINRVVTYKVAPIGTKPHTIAALLFACCYPRDTEIVYDNPVRTKVRTNGVGKVLVTCVSDLVSGRYNA